MTPTDVSPNPHPVCPPPRFCVLVPVYNHGLTVGLVVRAARAHFPVIVVNDGSTDQTAAALAVEADLEVVHLPENRGKGAALEAGFARADALGYTHAITIDADGQHPVGDIPRLADASRRQPEALIIGVRDLQRAGAPWPRRFSNALSTFWFRIETGVDLADTQCGFRSYPLATIRRLRIRAPRYAWELEIMVRASWAGIPLISQTVGVDYSAPTSRMSHFHPVRDFFQIARLHSHLAMQTFCVPLALRGMSARGELEGIPRGQRIRTVLRHFFQENAQTPGRLASAVGLGLFCGIAPIWGYQMAAAALLAHKLHLNKAIALTASNISFPLAAPFILAAALILGHALRTGHWLEFDLSTLHWDILLYFWDWVLGSIVLGLIVGLIGGAIAFLIAHLRQQSRRRTGDE